MKGEMPSGQGEIAIDRMYADNNSLKVGDTLDEGQSPGRSQVWWHFQITVLCFRIIMILCLIL